MEDERTTLGELAEWHPAPDEQIYFDRIIKILDLTYPKDWRLWVINKLSYEDLFGSKISPDDECRLRFAIPTLELVLAFSDGHDSISEKRFKKIKRTLLTWPLTRALIYSPFATMKKIHPVDAFNKFGEVITSLKPQFISRNQASELLKKHHTDNSSLSSLSTSRKRSRSPDKQDSRKKSRNDDGDSLTDYIKQQNSILENLVKQQNIMMEKLSNQNVTDNCNVPCNAYSSEEESWSAPSFHKQTDLESEYEEPTILQETENFLDFLPTTKESESKLGVADDTLVKQGVQCQRLGQVSWQNIRYADVQKRFQASPVFTNLKTNSNLATVTPPWQLLAALEKMDSCLGAITYGLLQQRKTFQDIYNQASLEFKAHISKHFLSEESLFRCTSDALLQYTCGKRAEVIQQRRNAYKTSNKALNELLHAIPPSSTHLFSEPELSDLIKEQGGTNKFFPGKFRSKSKVSDQNRRTTFKDKNSKYSEVYRRPAVRHSERSRPKTETFKRSAGQFTNKPRRGRKY